MSLLMLLIAAPYAPLAARGVLVDGSPQRPSFHTDEAEPRSRLRAAITSGVHARRTPRARARFAGDSLAA